VAPQIGFYYQRSDMMAIGASLTLPQHYGTYEWNSTLADPTSRGFGLSRTLSFDLDGPMTVSFGTGIKVNPKTSIAVDGMFMKYTGVNGFGSDGGVVNGVIQPFGWRNVWTFKAGVQHEVNEKAIVRVGYNFSQTPVRSEVVVSSIQGPLTYQNYFSGGVGLKMFPFLSAEASFYFAARGHVTGPFPNLNNQAIGTIDMSNDKTGALIGLNFRF
jgi:long-subunit fatty acid transport protein